MSSTDDDEGPPPPVYGAADPAESAPLYPWPLADSQPGSAPRSAIGCIAGAAVIVSVAAIAAAAVVVGYHLRPDPNPVASPTATPTTTTTTPPPPLPSTSTVTVTATPTSKRPYDYSKTTPVGVPPRITVTQPPRPMRSGRYTTLISWTGAACIDVRIPNGPNMPVETTCNGGTDSLNHTAVTGELVGADPIMGQATAIACRVIDDRTQRVLTSDSGTAGDGHDINCIVTAP